MRNVTIVVPVLMTSCQVSLNPNSGPVAAQTTMTPTAMRKAAGRPVACAVHLASRVNMERDFVGLMDGLSEGPRRTATRGPADDRIAGGRRYIVYSCECSANPEDPSRRPHRLRRLVGASGRHTGHGVPSGNCGQRAAAGRLGSFGRPREWKSWLEEGAPTAITPGDVVGPDTVARIQMGDTGITFRMAEFDPPNHWMWTARILWFTILSDHIFERVTDQQTRIIFHMRVTGFGNDLFAALMGAASSGGHADGAPEAC